METNIKQEEVDELVEQLIGSGDLPTALAHIGTYFIPKADAAKKPLEKLRTDAPLLSMIPIVVVNQDGHPTAKIGSLDEDAEGRLHKQLDQTLGFYQPFLMHTLAKLKEWYSPTVEWNKSLHFFACHRFLRRKTTVCCKPDWKHTGTTIL